MWGLKEKTNEDNKQTNKRNMQHKKREKEIPSKLNPFFRKNFLMQFNCFYLKIEFREIFKNTSFYRRPLVAASEKS